MTMWRTMARLGAVLACVAGVVLVGVQPASAARRDVVGLRVPSSFKAGGSAGSVVISVTKRSEGCVSARTAFAVSLSGLRADQLRVEVGVDGRWESVSVSSVGDDAVGTERRALGREPLCRGRSMAARYRVTFLPGAPAGVASVVAQASTADGDVIGRAERSSRVVAGPSPSPSPSASASPTADPAESEPTAAAPAAAAPASTGGDGGGWSGIGVAVVLIGLVMVGIGGALLAVILRRMRQGADAAPPDGYATGGAATQVMPTGGAATQVMPTGGAATQILPVVAEPRRGGRHRSVSDDRAF